MTARIVILSTLSLALLVAGFAAQWFGVVGMLDDQELTSALIDDQDEWARRQAWLNMLWMVPGPLVGAGLIAGVGALALVVRGHQVARIRSEPLLTASPGAPRQS